MSTGMRTQQYMRAIFTFRTFHLQLSKPRTAAIPKSIPRSIQTSTKMPAHPSEETAPSNLTDKVAQTSKDSTASDHPLHDENKGATEQAFSTGRSGGPQKSDNMPEAKSKEELKAKAEEMNK